MGDTRRFLPQLTRGALSLAFLFLVAVATAGIFSPLFIAILLSAGLAIAAIQALFPVSRLFSIAFANLIAVYAAIFSLFAEEVFDGVDPALLSIGFCLPIFAFVAGCWLRRDQVRAVVAHAGGGFGFGPARRPRSPSRNLEVGYDADLRGGSSWACRHRVSGQG
jgi:hypothetical protein